MRPRAVQGDAAERCCSNIEDRLRQKIPEVGKALERLGHRALRAIRKSREREKERVSIGDRV